MAANDTIADMLTRIRNAGLARHQTTDIPSTKMTRSIAAVLQNEGFIEGFSETELARAQGKSASSDNKMVEADSGAMHGGARAQRSAVRGGARAQRNAAMDEASASDMGE